MHEPLLGVFRGQEDVVAVNDHTGLQAGKDLQVFVEDISADLDDVARIDEQDVVRLEGGEAVEGLVLDLHLEEISQAGNTASQKGGGVRLDGGERTGVTLRLIPSYRLGGQQGGHTGANLDHSPGLEMPDHAVQAFRIHRPERGL